MSRLALTPAEAAEAIGVSRSFFDKQVKPQLKIVYKGGRIIVPVKSVEDWLEKEATTAC